MLMDRDHQMKIQIIDHIEQIEALMIENDDGLDNKYQRINEILNRLLSLSVAKEDINSSKISKTLKSLLGKGLKEISPLIRKLIIKWKAISQTKTESTTSKTEETKSATLELAEQEESTNDYKKKLEEEEKEPYRRNTKILIYSSLLKSNMDSKSIYGITLDIEQGIHNYFIVEQNKKNIKYLKHAKSIVMNLQNNPDFVDLILLGKLPGSKLAKMNPSDFASEEVKQLRLKLVEDAFNSRRSDWNRIKNPGVPGIYRCGKCKSNKTTYYQAQIRRADEPMTTFVSCLDCTHSFRQ